MKSEFSIDEFERFSESKKDKVVANFIFAIIVIVLIVIILIAQFFSLSEVVGNSMSDTIHDHDYVVCLAPSKLKRGDIVTADTGNKTIIKRIIGLPGERLVFAITDTEQNIYNSVVELYIDSGDGFVKQNEDFIRDKVMYLDGFYDQEKFTARGGYHIYYGDMDELEDSYIIELGKNEYFLMGDNRNSSLDSRNYGPFNKKDIDGRVTSIIKSGSAVHEFLNIIYSLFYI